MIKRTICIENPCHLKCRDAQLFHQASLEAKPSLCETDYTIKGLRIENEQPRKASLKAKPSLCETDYMINEPRIEKEQPRKASLKAKPSLN